MPALIQVSVCLSAVAVIVTDDRTGAISSLGIDSYIKLCRNSRKMRTYKIMNVNQLKSALAKKSERGGGGAPERKLNGFAKSFRITSLCKCEKQLSWNQIVAEKPGGGDGIKFDFKYDLRPANRLC